MAIIERFRENFEGISPVVGVILMVSITVGLSAVIGVTVFGLGNQVSENTGTIGLSSEQSGGNYTITAQSGQFDSFDYVYVTSTSTVRYSDGLSSVEYDDGPNNSAQYLYDGESGGAGTSVTVDTSTASESGQIQVIGVSAGNERVLSSYTIEDNAGSAVENTIEVVNESNLQQVLTNMSGDGTATNPYEISNVYELQAVQEDVDANYIVVNNIDASVTQEWNNSSGFIPIETFSGELDGQMYSIKNITINRTSMDDVGLIRYLDGTIQNIRLNTVRVYGNSDIGTIAGTVESGMISNADVSGVVKSNNEETFSGTSLGGITGRIEQSGTIGNTSFNGTVNASTSNAVNTGGIAGFSNGSITNSVASGTVSGVEIVGGIVGISDTNGMISNVSYTGKVDATGYDIGGIAGRNDGIIKNGTVSASLSGTDIIGGITGYASSTGEISTSRYSGNITATGYDIAGIAGYNGGIITKSVSKGNISGTEIIGGVAGYNSGNITDTYSGGVVNGNSTIGGFAGTNAGNIMNSYSTTVVNGVSTIGGFTSDNSGTVTDSYWDTELSGQSTSAGTSTPLTTNEMTGPDAETNMSGFDFTSVWITQTSDYPELQWENRTA